MDTAMQTAAMVKTEQAFQAAEKHYGRKFTRPKITFSKRMTRTAGKALGNKDCLTCKVVPTEIRFSDPLLHSEKEDFLARTPAHEAAHCVVWEMYGDAAQAHGFEWQFVMEQVMGVSSERCHSYKTPPVKRKKKVSYRTKCGTIVQLGPIQSKRLQSGQVAYYQQSKTKIKIYKEDICTPHSG